LPWPRCQGAERITISTTTSPERAEQGAVGDGALGRRQARAMREERQDGQAPQPLAFDLPPWPPAG